MPKHGRKGKTAKPLAVPSFDNKPRYSTPEVQQLPTPEPTPAVKARSRGLDTLEEATNRPLVRDKIPTRSKEEWEKEQEKWKQQVQREQATQEEMSAPEESDKEECEFEGPWVAKGNPPGFLDSEDEEVLDTRYLRETTIVKDALLSDDWRNAAEFLLGLIVNFTEDILVETDPKMKEYDLLLRILGMYGMEEDEAKEEITSLVQKAVCKRDNNYGMQDDTDDQIEALQVVNKGLREELAKLATGSESELQAKLAEQTHFMAIMVEQKIQRDADDARKETEHRKEMEEYEEKWRKWAEKEAQLKAGKAMSSERKKWQAKGKALPVEMVPNTTQTQLEEEKVKLMLATSSVQTVEMRQEEKGIQTEVDVLVEAMERKKNRKKGKGKERRKDEDTEMKDGSEDPNTDKYQEYEDLSGYEEEDETLAPEPPAKKKQAARRPAASAGKKSQPAKTPSRSISPNDILVKALVVHGIPCQRPLAELVQDVGPGGIMGAHWLLRGARRLGKTTSSVVIFFDKKLALGTHLKVKGRWHPTEAYDFDRGRRRVEVSDW